MKSAVFGQLQSKSQPMEIDMADLKIIEGSKKKPLVKAYAYLLTEGGDMRLMWESAPAEEVYQDTEDATLSGVTFRTVYAGDDTFTFPITVPIIVETKVQS